MHWIAGVVIALGATAAGQQEFHFNLSGGEETPPVVTEARGYGEVLVHPDLTYEVHLFTIRLQGVKAGIYVGDVGTPGKLLTTFSGGPNQWNKAGGPLTALQLDDLVNGRIFARVTSTAYPLGEIRGQIYPSPTVFAATLDGAQVVPPPFTRASGTARFIVNADRSVTYAVGTFGLSGISAHVCAGAFGIAGAPIFVLHGGPIDWAGRSAPLTVDQFAQMQQHGLYVTVDTVDFPAGQIRGQILAEETPYGVSTGTTKGECKLRCQGAPMVGSELTITVAGGVRDGIGAMWLATEPGALKAGDFDFLLGGMFEVIPITLDQHGRYVVSGQLPEASSIDVYLQFFGDDPTQVRHRLYASNAIKVALNDF